MSGQISDPELEREYFSSVSYISNKVSTEQSCKNMFSDLWIFLDASKLSENSVDGWERELTDTVTESITAVFKNASR